MLADAGPCAAFDVAGGIIAAATCTGRMPSITTPELRAKIAKLPENPRALALALVAYGPASASELAKACDRKPAWVYNNADQLRNKLQGIGEVVHDETGYWLRPAPKPLAPVTPILRKPEPPANEPTPTPVRPAADHKRRIFVLPWGGYIEVDAVIGCTAERSCVLIQLRGGGYIRSAVRSDAEDVVAAITGHAHHLDGAVVVSEPVLKEAKA